MSNTSLRLTTAAVLSCLASIALAAPDSATSNGGGDKADASKVDECLSGPKGVTPPGGHWYYRLERGTKRKCWYLADEGAKVKSAAKPAASAPREAKSTEPPMKPKVANAHAEVSAPTAPIAEWPLEADAQIPARRATQTLASAAPDNARESLAQNSQAQDSSQGTPSSQPESTGAQASNASPSASTNTTSPLAAAVDPQPQAQPATAQPAAPPPVSIRTAVVRPVPSQAAPQQSAESAINPLRIALGLLAVGFALVAFMSRHLLQRLGRRYFGARTSEQRSRRDIWAPLDQDADRTTYADMIAEPVELTEPPRWVRNVRELSDTREHVEPLRAQAPARAYDDRIEPRRSADELEELLRRASQRPAPREAVTPRVVSAARARTSTGPSGARA